MSSEAVPLHDVLVLRWPAEAAELSRLEGEGVPRLLLVTGDAPPPETADCLQDWVQMPAEDREVQARLAGLRARAASHRPPPRVDDNGRVFYNQDWVALSPVEHRIFSALLLDFGAVVAEETLLAVVWSDQRPTSNSFRVHLTRLRRRLRPIGLEIRAVRLRGYVLQEISTKEPHRTRARRT